MRCNISVGISVIFAGDFFTLGGVLTLGLDLGEPAFGDLGLDLGEPAFGDLGLDLGEPAFGDLGEPAFGDLGLDLGEPTFVVDLGEFALELATLLAILYIEEAMNFYNSHSR